MDAKYFTLETTAPRQLVCLRNFSSRPSAITKSFTAGSRATAFDERHRRSVQCQAAASDLSARQDALLGDPDFPIVTGLLNTIEWLTDYQKFYEKRFAKFGSIFRTNVLFNPMVVVTNETEVERLLKAEHKLVESAWPTSMRNLLGPNSILTAGKQQHKQQRQILSQAFTEAAMREYLPTILDVSKYTLEQWAGSTEPVRFYGAAKCFAFDVAATVLTGVRYNENRLVSMREHFETYSAGLFALPFDIPGTPYGKAIKARKIISADIERLIMAAKEQNDSSESSGRKNALQMLLEAQSEDGVKLSMEQLKDQVLTQLFAGHETTGATLSQVLPELQKQPQILEQLRAEQAGVISRHGDKITYDVLEDMPYADAVIKEVMRLFGIVDGIWRQTLEEITIQGHQIPKGWTVQLMVKRSGLAAEEFQEDAHQFKPSRWLENNGQPLKTNPKSFMPFGGGPRVCLGMLLAKMEMRALLAVMARGYTVELEDPHEHWFQGFKPVNGLPGRVYRLP